MDDLTRRSGEAGRDADEQRLSINKDTLQDLDNASPEGDDAVKGGRAKVTAGCGDYPVTGACTVA